MLRQLAGVCLLLSQIVLCRTGYTQVDLPWRQYYRVINQYNAPKAGRPERIRVGHGRYRMSANGAELLCDFPSTAIIVSNIVWERADLGALRDLDQLYKSVGESRAYAVVPRPNGSTLRLQNASPVDRGLYRCMATAADPSTNAIFTLFQDIPFYPEFGYHSKQLPSLVPQHQHQHQLRPAPCCRLKEVFRDYHHHQHHQSASLVVKSLSRYY